MGFGFGVALFVDAHALLLGGAGESQLGADQPLACGHAYGPVHCLHGVAPLLIQVGVIVTEGRDGAPTQASLAQRICRPLGGHRTSAVSSPVA